MAKSFVELVDDEIQRMVDMRMETLATGSVGDNNAFRELRGTIQGLVLAQETIKDLARKQLKDDEDDED